MMKSKFLSITVMPIVAVLVVLLLTVLPGTVLAQETVPPPYAGLKNPFPWESTSAQEAGKNLYQKSCLGCHGARGNGMTSADFSKADFRRNLEGKPDFYFWILSEGRLNKGMPPFKSAFSEEQRWQTLTYLWSLAATPVSAPSETPSPVSVERVSLALTAPKEGSAGQLLTFTAVLEDKEGKPLSGATMKFLAKLSFLNGGGLMEIGEAITDSRGMAVLQYTPRFDGDVQIVARYQTVETTAALTLTKAEKPFYRTEVGIELPAPGKEVVIGPMELGEEGMAPMTVFRLPGGILSWLLIIAATIALVWFSYFRVIYQVLRIPIVSEIMDTDTRLIPLVGLLIVVTLGIVLLLMLLTGPYSHHHLHIG